MKEYRLKIRKSRKSPWKYVSGVIEHALGLTWQTTNDIYKAMRTTNPDYISSMASDKFFFEFERC